ncbi:hypothetical protein FJR48_08610 [Sulfurimonas lithotrophica]|uniref:Uncharacterized protein n=1 Tax=Sulfurimonas lithotrophica TaxID=2590022 RepID=A0A5P8P230_9BACT|nr:hypothetical protein [Sulfurimonas lithotrophica]QFR49788.1 hypothetical protein FJR48_08610 [Sulfurimonas lithotrophica]
MNREELRLEKLNNILIGNKDASGRIVYDVYARSEEFVIYSVQDSGMIEGIAVIIEEKKEGDLVPTNNFQSVKGEFDKLKAVSFKATNKSYSARVAHALSVAIFGEPDKAKKILEDIHANIEDVYKELVIGKLIYIFGAFLIAVFFSSVSIFLYVCQPEFIIQERPNFYNLFLVCSMATLGGLISVSRSITKINVDKGLGKWPYFVYGIERNVFSILGGVFIFLLIKANLLFGFINSLDNPLYGLLTFGFLAGFSETLIPNALKNLENKANNEASK